MPVFNADAYLGAAIKSILNQSYHNLELIIINDGSTDKCDLIIESFQDDRIRLLNNEVNRGLVYSLNLGLDHAAGDYIARMDADDIALPERISKQVAFLDSKHEYVLCGSFYKVMDTHGNVLHKVELPENDRDIRTFLLFSNCFCHSTVMFRANLKNKFKYEQQFFLTEDYKLWYDFSKTGLVYNLPSHHVLYRVHQNNISFTKKAAMQLKLREMYEIVLRDLQIEHTDDELGIHTNFLVFNHEFFKHHQDMINLESWMIKIYARLKKDPTYNQRVIARIFLRRWFVICFKARHFDKMIFSSLFLHFKWDYLRQFTEKIGDYFLRRNLGIDF
jgi:glycosyltransferase involved in cell wall biosynthesis